MKKAIIITSSILLLALGAHFGFRAYHFTTQKCMAAPMGWGQAVSIAEYEDMVEEFGRPLARVFSDQGFTTDHWYEKLQKAKARRDTSWALSVFFTAGGAAVIAHLFLAKRKQSGETQTKAETIH